MKQIVAYISNDEQLWSLNSEDIVLYEVEQKRKVLILTVINKELAISPEDDLKQVISEFLSKQHNFDTLGQIFVETAPVSTVETPEAKKETAPVEKGIDNVY